MKKKIMAGAVLLLAASIFIGGCGIKSVSTDTGAGYTVTDATGREVKIPKKPERIMGTALQSTLCSLASSRRTS